MPESAQTPLPWRALIVLSVVAMTSAVGMGTSVLAVPILLEGKGYSASLIGFLAAVYSMGLLVTGLAVPALIRFYGHVVVIIGGSVTLIIGTLLTPVLIDIMAGLMAARFLAGIGTALVWVASESWFCRLSVGRNLSRLVGIYFSSWGVGAGLGALLVLWLDSNSAQPFILHAVMEGMTIPAIAWIAAKDLRGQNNTGLIKPFYDVIRTAPLIPMLAILAGIAEVAVFALWPVYALRIGWVELWAGLGLVAFIFGGVIAPILIGEGVRGLANKTMILIIVLLSVAAIVLVMGHGAPSLWMLGSLFIWGGAAAGLYTIIMILVGGLASGDDVTIGNSLLVTFYTMGMVVGPYLAGVLMDVFSLRALFWFLLVINGAIALVSMIQKNSVEQKTL
ncbi:MAG: MFS transporter [Pseudomonadota bacterium]